MKDDKKSFNFSAVVVISLVLAIGSLLLLATVSDGNGRQVAGMPDPSKVREAEVAEERMSELEEDIKRRLPNLDGKWSIYVMDLTHENDFCINSEPMYAASLIKLFVMESCYAHMDALMDNARAYYGEADGAGQVSMLMENMITLSDNESYNELVRLHSPNHSFVEGCHVVNDYIHETGYKDTNIYHTLHPSASVSETAAPDINMGNTTSARDCGRLLERIYFGKCVSEKASETMENLLFKQGHLDKIPAGTSHASKVGNKTGETDTDQHDVAIIYSEDMDYILCIMTEDLRCTSEDAMFNVEGMSRVVDKALNGEAEPWQG